MIGRWPFCFSVDARRWCWRKNPPECQCRFCRDAVHKLSGWIFPKAVVYRYDRHLSHFVSWNSPGHFHDTEDSRRIRLAAEVGLLTRNIQIKSDLACTGRMLVGHFMDSSGREFEGSSNLPILINQTSSAQEELFNRRCIHWHVLCNRSKQTVAVWHVWNMNIIIFHNNLGIGLGVLFCGWLYFTITFYILMNK